MSRRHADGPNGVDGRPEPYWPKRPGFGVAYWVLRYGLEVLMRLLYRVKVEGSANVPRKGSVILAANHLSAFDSPFFATRVADLLWRPVGVTVRFVLVIHPTRGRKILLCTDAAADPLAIIRLYGIRFKIEVSFKQAVHTLGAYAYHFWMRAMKPRPRESGNQDVTSEPRAYREAVRRKVRAYHLHIQAGVIAQGLLQSVAVLHPRAVWRAFGSWLRTIRPGVPPSERVASLALRNTLPEFLADALENHTLAKFIRRRVDPGRAEGMRLVS